MAKGDTARGGGLGQTLSTAAPRATVVAKLRIASLKLERHVGCAALKAIFCRGDKKVSGVLAAFWRSNCAGDFCLRSDMKAFENARTLRVWAHAIFILFFQGRTSERLSLLFSACIDLPPGEYWRWSSFLIKVHKAHSEKAAGLLTLRTTLPYAESEKNSTGCWNNLWFIAFTMKSNCRVLSHFHTCAFREEHSCFIFDVLTHQMYSQCVKW